MIDLSGWSAEEARQISDCINGNDPERQCPACRRAAQSDPDRFEAVSSEDA